jgi:RNA polymerase sigma-70 factor, ECF subfamily
MALADRMQQSGNFFSAHINSDIFSRMNLDATNLETLLAQTAQGNHASFADIYKRTQAHLFGVAVRILGQGQVAEDALQEAYVSIWKNAASYRSEVGGQTIQPMTWLIAIARNKALDAYRSRARRKESELPESDNGTDNLQDTTAPSAAQLLDQASHTLHIDGCMSGLDGSHRQSLALAYYQGLSHSEIAAQMGAPLGSVKAWIRRGLEKLKACLAAQGIKGAAA